MEFRNFLLGALRPDDAAVLVPSLKEMSLSAGHVLYEPDSEIGLLYFPSSACLSVAALLRDGRAFEVATVGRESAPGLLDVITGQAAAARCFVQSSGSAMALPASVFRARLADSPALLRLALLHVRAVARQAEALVACNIAHDAEARLARWLLMTADRTGSERFLLTQEYMAVMTGVQRSTVSQIATRMKRGGLIDYSRGHVTILDRPRLEALACECYADVQAQFEALRGKRGGDAREPPGGRNGIALGTRRATRPRLTPKVRSREPRVD